ncbi:MAG: M23 family metallopeptidase [Spirochaetaceae bacterium]|jgi:murein DD-endopeptidase MepM/ murein hydrolase activator NlpD|nr:M23 family metallopeptidase [Spirochaetaceae bacterium]
MKWFDKLRAFTAALLVLAAGAAAGEMDFTQGDWACALRYNDTVDSGDAVFVRLAVTRQGTLSLSAASTIARLSLGSDAGVDFYPVPSGKGTSPGAAYTDFLAGLPVSTRQKAGDLTLTVTILLPGADKKNLTLPVTVRAKEFLSFTLKLDQANTDRMTDNSPARIAQSDRLNRAVSATNPRGVYQQSPFALPTGITRITDRFGTRRVYQYADGKTNTSVHWGTDYGAPKGTPVRSCAAGRVVLAEMRNQTGWSVIVEHLPGLYSLYYHLDSLAVEEGMTVRQSGLLGYSGATGIATGPHLHWEMRLNTQAVNPAFFCGNFAHLEPKNTNQE